MAGLFFSFSLVLRYPTASPPRRKGDPHVYMYSSDVGLDDSRMTVMVPVPVGTFYPDGTRAQVMGPADVVGDTIFMRTGPAVFPSDDTIFCRPFVFATASVAAWAYGVFSATVDGGTRWPPPMDLMCSYDAESDHLRSLHVLPPATVVVIAGNIVDFEDGTLQIAVHDLSLRGEAPPCSASSFAGAPLRRGQRRALCHWLKTYYPGTEPARTVYTADAADARSDTALSPAVPVHALCQMALLQSMPPSSTADDEAAFCRLLDDTAVTVRAARHVSLPMVSPSAGDSPASSRDSHATAEAHSVHDTPTTACPNVAVASTQDGAVTGASTPDEHQVPGRSLAEELAIRDAIEFAFARRDEGPIGQTPVAWGMVDAESESPSPSPLSNSRRAGPRGAGAPRAREVIDLTADSSDDEDTVPVCTHSKVFMFAERLPSGRVVSCTW